MEIKQIKDLMQAMGRSGIRRLHLKRDGFEIDLEREEEAKQMLAKQVLEFVEENPMRNDIELHRARASLKATPKQEEASPPADDSSLYVKSPMVGTYYAQPGPDDPPFAKVGDSVNSETVVCIIEAMKVMNEVKAGVSGIITEILVETGQPVEFGTKLFRIQSQ